VVLKAIFLSFKIDEVAICIPTTYTTKNAPDNNGFLGEVHNELRSAPFLYVPVTSSSSSRCHHVAIKSLKGPG
jgi:hypothetical protein